MPVVSEKQRKAMWAAAKGESTLGIPATVAREFLSHDDQAKQAAGTIFIAPDGAVLLLNRSPNEANYAGHWALPGGCGEEGETPWETACREAEEELGPISHALVGGATQLSSVPTPNGMAFTTFIQPVRYRFAPELNGEHAGYVWAMPGEFPQPLHPQVAFTLAGLFPEENEMKIEVAQDENLVAMDRSSARRFDADGHLLVSDTPFTKANVCPYYGREIPDNKALGLDPDRLYYLLRDPEELKKGIKTFEGKPLLLGHKAASAEAHDEIRGQVVGAMGHGLNFDGTYGRGPMTIWDGKAIKLVESNKQRQLSASYRYDADMTPGTYNGQKYDGVMRNISGNHVAIVPEGRAGPDVLVQDAALKKDFEMSFKGKFAAKANDEWSEEARRKAAETRAANSKNKTLPTHGPAGMSVEQRKKAYTESKGKSRQMEALKETLRKKATEAYHGQKQLREKIKKGEATKKDMQALKQKESMLNKRSGNASYRSTQAAEKTELAKRHYESGKKYGVHDKAHDHKPKEMNMAKKMSLKAAVAKGALMVHLAPMLAADAAIDLKPALEGITSKNWKEKRPGLEAAVSKLVEGKLAADAQPQIGKILLALDEDDDEEEEQEAMDESEEDDDKKAEDEEEDDTEAKKKAEDEDEDDDDDDKDPKANDSKFVSRAAMDSAIRKSVDSAVKMVRQQEQERRIAEEAVRPFVGKLAMDQATASDIYGAALKSMNVDIKGLPDSALKPLFEATSKVHNRQAARPKVAMDHNNTGSTVAFKEMFPNAQPLLKI